MSSKKVKTSAKWFVSDRVKINQIVTDTMRKIANVVGGTLGPSGRICLIESEHYGIPNKNTKDGVTVFKSLGAENPYEHLIIEQTRDAAIRTASEAGDGTTSSTILAANLTIGLLEFCDRDNKFSPQKVTRIINKTFKDKILPAIQASSIAIDETNPELLHKVAKVSANGEEEIADAVIEAFEKVGYGSSSHVTIQELSGPGGYKVDLIDGYPIPMGYEESIGKFHTAFINDQGNLRCILDKPLFLLYDGIVNDMIKFEGFFEEIGKLYESGKSEYKNVVFVSHGFGENVLNQLALNFVHPSTINVFPLVTPMNAVINSRQNFMQDLAAFVGAKVFGMKDPVSDAQVQDLGGGMETFEAYRFRATVVGDSDEMFITERAKALKTQLQNPASDYDKRDLEERLGKLTNGIAMIKVYGGSSGELKEKHDRVEDAVCAVRAAISYGVLPGGCRMLTTLAVSLMRQKGSEQEVRVWREILAPALMSPLSKLLENAGYNSDECKDIISKLTMDESICYDVENQVFGKAEELGLFDATKAVEEALKNAISIASVMGVMGGLVCFPRDNQLERQEAMADMEHQNVVNNPHQFENEANNRW